MGYTTNFKGCFKFNRQLTLNEKNELDGISSKYWGDDNTKVGSYCHWVSDKQGLYLEWDNGEKFYGYIEWLKWLIENFFKPKKIVLNGSVDWSGEEKSDIGKIIVKNNGIEIKEAKIVYTTKTVKSYKV